MSSPREVCVITVVHDGDVTLTEVYVDRTQAVDRFKTLSNEPRAEGHEDDEVRITASKVIYPPAPLPAETTAADAGYQSESDELVVPVAEDER